MNMWKFYFWLVSPEVILNLLICSFTGWGEKISSLALLLYPLYVAPLLQLYTQLDFLKTQAWFRMSPSWGAWAGEPSESWAVFSSLIILVLWHLSWIPSYSYLISVSKYLPLRSLVSNNLLTTAIWCSCTLQNWISNIG